MRLKVDEGNDVLYFRLDETAIVDSEEIKPGVILDYNQKGDVVGVEILHVRERVSPLLLKTLQFETV
ncbi:MAG: DUF2283 domain-containing protein [Elusimicrobia bacterium]|nr:DUF2283 domain-containing protein [Elusimicrobiota bacterium]